MGNKAKRYYQYVSDRGKYICQSQSLNLFLENPSISKLTSIILFME